VTFRTRLTLAALVGVSLTQALAAQAADTPAEPPRLDPVPGQSLTTSCVNANQRMADTIADQLRQNGQLRHYDLDVVCRDGAVWIAGAVRDQPQREEALRVVRGVGGVDRVFDHITLADALERIQAQVQPPFRAPDPTPGQPGTLPPGGAPPAAGRPAIAEPMPIFQAPPPSPYDLNPPRMPPYAWPTYAPYNNFSRVAIPEAYPYNAWPFIGPCYPFPKVPLGWRSVKLEWDDGHWWYSKTATKYDWWRLRFW
jgi:BON domain